MSYQDDVKAAVASNDATIAALKEALRGIGPGVLHASISSALASCRDAQRQLEPHRETTR